MVEDKIDTVRERNASTGKGVVDAVVAPSKSSPLIRTSGVVVVGGSSHHPPEQKNNAQQERQQETNPIDFIEQSFACAAAAPAEMKYAPTREEIGRALKRAEGDIPGAIEILRQQWTIKIESKELGKAMEESLRENEENEKKRKREEEEERKRDPVGAYASGSAMSAKALKRMFLGGIGANASKATELCEFEKKAKKWYKSAHETIEDVFEQIGTSVEFAKTDDEVGEILKNSIEMLFEQTLKMPLKSGAVPEIFASEEAFEGKNLAAEEVVELGSSSDEEEEGEGGDEEN
jgi:hypothetical protein